jgi:glycosyltransferase involved in cell wall biosynthesis
MTPTISVLTTSFNREYYISQAIESVLASTYKDLELIIVDDCSSDKTVEIAKKYEAKDSRVKVFVNEKNLGDYPNRNKAASYARGKYIKYVDADDYIYPNGLEIIVNQMEKFPDAAVGLFSLPQNIQKPFPILLSPREAYLYNFFGQGLFHKAPLSAIIRKDAFDQVGGFSLIRHAGDFDMWHKMAQRFSFLLIQDHIVWFREHDDQESKKHNIQIEINYSRIEYMYIVSPDSPLTMLERNEIIKNKVINNFKFAFLSLLKPKFRAFILFTSRILVYKGWKK